MKKLVLFIIFISCFGIDANAAEYLSGETIKVAFVDTVDQDIFGGARNIEIYGFVDGDIYAGCENISIEGKVADDVLVGCRTLTVTGVIGDGLIFFGETVVIDGSVHGDIMAFGKEVRITDRAKLGGNLYVGCGQLRLDGAPVAGFLKGEVGDAYLNGPVGDEVELEVGHINFGQEYAAGGGTLLKLREELDRTKLDFEPADLETVVKPRDRFFQNVFFYWSFFALLVTGLILISLFRNFSTDLISWSRENIPANSGTGFLALVATPVIIVILTVFIVTIPAALILLAWSDR